MAYGAGRSRLIAEIGKEEAFEERRYDEELVLAEEAARRESEGKTLSSAVGSGLGLLWGLYTGNPYKGYLAGREGGTWLHNLFSGYDPGDYALSTDMGRFDVQDAYKMEDVNRRFQEAYEAQFWQDVAGTGQTLGSMALLGGDSGGESAWKRFLKSQGEPAETFHWG